jgi:CheY-like chemotaxis protein
VEEPILVVDDEEDLRYVLARQLQMGGFQVETATDGEAAIQKLREREYPVIITDMKMPRKDGLSVISAARETSSRYRDYRADRARHFGKRAPGVQSGQYFRISA